MASQAIAPQPKTNPAPNFFVTNSVIVDAPWQKAYRTFATTYGHERVCRLSDLCTKIELHDVDTIHLPMPEYPEGRLLEDVALRAIAAPDAGVEASPSSPPAAAEKLAISRQHFLLEETVPLLFGLFKSRVALKGTLSWDNALLTDDDAALPPPATPIQALYESRTHNGIEVWKLRTFEPLSDNKTKITERIEGSAPVLLRWLVESETQKAHRAQMDLYQTLL